MDRKRNHHKNSKVFYLQALFFNMSNMGKTDIVSHIVSHSKSKKHMEKINRSSISTLFFKNFTQLNKDAVAKPSEIGFSSNHRSCKTTNLTSLVIKWSVTKAEVLWCLKTSLHSSFRSYENISNLFSVMFSDSGIAKSFSVGKTKCTYYINLDIASYFKELLLEKIDSSNTLLFLMMKA